MPFDVQGARKAGYSDTEIADHLASESKFDAAGARKAGYTDADIIGHLSAAPAAAAPEPEPDRQSGMSLSDLVTGKKPVERPPWAQEGLGAAVFDRSKAMMQSPGGRFLMGATEPVLGLLQTQAEAGRAIGNRVADFADRNGIPTAASVRSMANAWPDYLADALQKKGEIVREKIGDSSDIAGTAGAITTGVLATKGMPTPAGLVPRVATGAAAGGLAGSATPVEDPSEGFWGQKAQQTAGGAALGGALSAAIPPVAKATGWALGKAKQGVQSVVDRVTAGGPRRIAERVLRDMIAPDTRNTLAGALRNAPENVPFSQPTAAQAVAHTPEGALLQGVEQVVASRPGSAAAGNPVTWFNRRAADQENALTLAKQARDDLTAEMRSTALNLADKTAGRIQELGATIRDRLMSKARALQDKGKFETEASIQSRLADQQPPPGGGPVTDALGLRGRQAPSAPPTAAGAAPRAPGRYTPQAARAEENAAAAGEMPAIVRQRQAELEMAQREADQLGQQGAKPLTSERVAAEVGRIENTPGLRASTVVQKAMDSVKERLAKLQQADGTVNAHDLYMLRKELGNEIDKAMTESASFDKKLAGGLRSDLQKAIDSAIEDALPGEAKASWREYLRTYAEKSERIDREVARMEQAYKPRVSPNLGNVEADPGHLPPLLSRERMIADALLSALTKKNRPKVDAELAKLLLGNDKTGLAELADVMSRPDPKRALIDALSNARGRPTTSAAASTLMNR